MRTRVIALANQKGGVGKTTTTINLAACLAKRKRAVLVVDLDPQCNTTSGLGVAQEPGNSVYNALLGQGQLTALVRKTKTDGLSVVPSEVDLAGAEIDVARSDRYLHRFTDALAPLLAEDRYDFVFVDCPPSLGILTMNGLAAAHSVIIPMQCEYYALEGLTIIKRVIDTLRNGGANSRLELEGILMTMHDSRTRISSEVVEDVRQYFGDKVYQTVIPRNVRLSEAPSFGIPIIEYDASSPGARAYERFAEEFLDRLTRSAGAQDSPSAVS